MPVLSLRSKLLTGALLLVAVPLLVAALLLPPRIEAALAVQGRAQLAQTAQDLATLAEHVIGQHRDAVRSVATITSVTDAIQAHNAGQLDAAGLTRLNQQLGALLTSLGQHYQGLWAADTAGFIFAGTLKSGDTAPYTHLDVHERPYYIEARRSLQAVISEPMISKVGNVPIIVITVPLKTTGGEFAGLVGLSVEVDYLARIISSQKFGATGYPFAIDRRGLMIAHPDPERVMKLDFNKVAGAERVARRMLAGETGLEAYVSSKGDPKLAAFAPVPITGWSIAASQETAEFIRPIRQLHWFFYALIVVCLAAAAGAAALFANGVTRPVRHVATVLADATRVMDAGTGEIATSSNTLAASASEQAAGIEQTSASLTELTATTRSNSDHANEAARLASASGQHMQTAGERMRDLEQAVKSAAAASEQTRKVIKTIDEIAFQTNILALNAAVEAARAGEAGAGFAVVADEVRNLAGRAANAARESTETLQSVGDLVRRSLELAGATSQEFGVVQADSQTIGVLVADIATACREQSASLEQINNSLAQFEQGTQAGAAHAEEAAAAAQELRAQAAAIRHEIGVLNRLIEGHRAAVVPPPPVVSSAPLVRPSSRLVRPARRLAASPA